MTKVKSRFSDLLKGKNLKVTQPRVHVLEIISNKKYAVSQPELEKLLGDEFDRVTLYRSLAAFEEKGILHKILDLNGTATYALCAQGCDEVAHDDRHAHFICSSCNNILCLDEVILPQINVPKGYTIQQTEVTVIGLCAKCTD